MNKIISLYNNFVSSAQLSSALAKPTQQKTPQSFSGAFLFLNITTLDKAMIFRNYRNTIRNFILFFLMLLLFSLKTYAQDTNTAATNENKYGRFAAEAEMIAYGRMSDLIEQTGNEDTLGVLLDAKFHYIKDYKYGSIEANFDGRVYQQLSHKARFYDDMNPPLFDFKVMNVAAVMKYGTVRIGILKSYMDNIPMDSYFPSLFYQTTVSGNTTTVLSGPRDLPIGYNTQMIPTYDTGLMYELSLHGLFVGLGVVNGEMGLDANSSKGIMAKISYSNDYVNAGVSGYVTQIGSIPIKEYGDSVNVFAYTHFGKNKNFTIGVEGFWFRHGIMRDNDYSSGTGVDDDDKYNYNDGYFTDFSIQTFFGENPYYALAGFVFFEARDIWNFDILTHVGIYDPNIYSEAADEYSRKYRTFIRITYNVTDDFKVMLSHTFTYDKVFINNYQYYELERRYQLYVLSYDAANGGHYTMDMDYYLGVSYKFGTKNKVPQSY